jgi:hypothetical protein
LPKEAVRTLVEERRGSAFDGIRIKPSISPGGFARSAEQGQQGVRDRDEQQHSISPRITDVRGAKTQTEGDVFGKASGVLDSALRADERDLCVRSTDRPDRHHRCIQHARHAKPSRENSCGK